jgi:hypothetical protein
MGRRPALTPAAMTARNIERAAQGDRPSKAGQAAQEEALETQYLYNQPLHPDLQKIDDRKAAVNVTAWLKRHPCALDPEAGVTTCDVPGHAEDVKEIGLMLETIGLKTPAFEAEDAAEWLTAREAGQILGITPTAVRNMGTRRTLARTLDQGQWHFLRSDVLAVAQRRRQAVAS